MFFFLKFYLLIKNQRIKSLKKFFEKISEFDINIKKVKRNYEFYKNLPAEKYEEELKIWYKKEKGEELDLNNPKTFNEKIQWLKLYDSTPEKTLLADIFF